MLTSSAAARLIDISAVRTHHTRQDVEELVAYGKKYRFINLHVLPVWVSTLSEMLKDESDILVGAPVGFPSGGHTTEIKMAETKQLMRDGVQEMDIVMNLGKFRSREYDYVLDELQSIIQFVDKRVLTKVIVEINILNDDEMLRACDLVMQSGADFVKTGTGWVPGGANLKRIRKIKEHCGNDIKVKAAGGIRTKEEFLAGRQHFSGQYVKRLLVTGSAATV